MENVLVVSAHPDDETIGCGGTILKHIKNGDKVHWMILTNIDNKNGWPKSFVSRRKKEIDDISKIYSFTSVSKLNFPTTKLNEIPEGEMLINIGLVLGKVKPSVLYLPNKTDIHSDHQITFKMVYSAAKNFRAPYIKTILMYECLSETEFAVPLPDSAFVPNRYTDIGDFFEGKLKAMKVYASEIMADPLPRSLSSIEALARYRGCRIGCKFAEAFMILLEIK